MRQLTAIMERMELRLLADTQRLTVALGRSLRGEAEEEVESSGAEMEPPLPPIVEDVRSVEGLPTFA